VDLTNPAPRELRVTLALLATVKALTPVEEATTKMLVVGKVDVPWTDRVAMGELEPMPTKPLALTVK
jgi:hypothetical protein